MLHSLQAHYLKIEWQEHGRARSIMVAPEPIEITDSDEGTMMAETLVFHDLCPWVGLRLEGNLSTVQPAFERADGGLAPMLRLDDGRGGHWWVQNDGWDPDGKRHLSELHRSIGQFTIVMGTHRLLLNNMVGGLGRVEIEEYLHDFQQDLIWLVMGFGGAQGAISNSAIVNHEMVDALETFTAASREVLAHPARNVREVQIQSRPARLRPNPATFRQYLRTPAAQRLPGRGAEETADIADNRYLRHMVQVCEKLSNNLAKSVERHATRFADRARVEAERAVAYKSMTHRPVDPDIFDRQLADLARKLRRVEAYSDGSPELDETLTILEFRPGSPYGGRSDTIFFNHKDGSRATDENKESGYGFSVIRIPEELLHLIQSTQSFCDYYWLEGAALDTVERTKKGNKAYRHVHFTRIYCVRSVTKAIERKMDRRAKLANNDWLAPLTAKEREENNQEARTARLREQSFQQYGQQAQHALSALSRCRVELRTHDVGWQKLGVASSVVLPMGVRFSQTPHYTACQVAFSEVIRLAQCSGLGADTLDAIDRISVLHASALYERWCLVKILTVLLEDYRFKPEAGWQEQLVRAITGKPESVELKLHREEVGMWAFFEVQPVLPNGRRPDFRLRFSYDAIDPTTESENDDGWWSDSFYGEITAETAAVGLIMDAKFRTSWQKGDLGRMLTSLIEEKDYGQLGDRVFILHPAPKTILKPTSPLNWGRDCDYGQEAGKKHLNGVIYLAPGMGEASPEINLRRLMILQLQSTFSAPVKDTSAEHASWTSKSFCIRCGKAHLPQDIKQQLTKRGSLFWTLSCAACQMQTTRTHCYGCDSSVLFKNGTNLTYHRTVADQITNIVCPKCGRYFDNEVHGNGNSSGAHDAESYGARP